MAQAPLTELPELHDHKRIVEFIRDSNSHIHKCFCCNKFYIHSHSSGFKIHPQRFKQCPWADCLQYQGASGKSVQVSRYERRYYTSHGIGTSDLSG